MVDDSLLELASREGPGPASFVRNIAQQPARFGLVGLPLENFAKRQPGERIMRGVGGCRLFRQAKILDCRLSPEFFEPGCARRRWKLSGRFSSNLRRCWPIPSPSPVQPRARERSDYRRQAEPRMQSLESRPQPGRLLSRPALRRACPGLGFLGFRLPARWLSASRPDQAPTTAREPVPRKPDR